MGYAERERARAPVLDYSEPSRAERSRPDGEKLLLFEGIDKFLYGLPSSSRARAETPGTGFYCKPNLLYSDHMNSSTEAAVCALWATSGQVHAFVKKVTILLGFDLPQSPKWE